MTPFVTPKCAAAEAMLITEPLPAFTIGGTKAWQTRMVP